MPRSENQKLKLYYIIEFFMKKSSEEHPVSVNDIIEYLSRKGINAERKSVYRDIEAMTELGYDVVQIRNKHFLYYLGERVFQNAELRLLVDAVQASRFITEKKSDDLIQKLGSLVSEYDAQKLQSQVYVTNRIKSSNESIYYTVDAIHNAIQNDSKIRFFYYDWDLKKEKVFRHEKKVYCISPWSLIWNNENYYLIGYDSENELIKHYRVDRMISLEISDIPREGKEAFEEIDIEHYSECYFGMYSGEIEKVTLKCSNKLTNPIIDKFGKDIAFLQCKDEDAFVVNVKVAVSPVFFSWVFMFGGDVKIIAPQRVATEMKNMVKKFIEQ